MAERKVDWGRQASYCRLQAKIGTCIKQLKVRGSSQVNVMYKIIQEVCF